MIGHLRNLTFPTKAEKLMGIRFSGQFIPEVRAYQNTAASRKSKDRTPVV